MTRIIAHRGLSSKHRGNSMDAYKAAIDAGFKFIETDVREHKGRIVISHNKPRRRSSPITLESVFKELGDKVGYYIELKDVASARKVCRLAKEYKVRAVFISFHLDALSIVKGCSNYDIEVLLRGAPGKREAKHIKELGCRKINFRSRNVPPKKVDGLVKKYSIGIWTVNNPISAEAYVKHGVKRIITDSDVVLKKLK